MMAMMAMMAIKNNDERIHQKNLIVNPSQMNHDFSETIDFNNLKRKRKQNCENKNKNFFIVSYCFHNKSNLREFLS